MPQAQPAVVPDDGLTTRQRRNRAILAVHTGVGKGKSTAAFGLALRGWNQGWDIGVFHARALATGAHCGHPSTIRAAMVFSWCRRGLSMCTGIMAAQAIMVGAAGLPALPTAGSCGAAGAPVGPVAATVGY